MSKQVNIIRKEIKAIAGAVSKLNERVQVCLIDCAEHASEHGDTSLIGDLRTALGPNLTRRFERYCATMLPVRFTSETCKKDKDSEISWAEGLTNLRTSYWHDFETKKSAPKVRDVAAIREYLARMAKEDSNADEKARELCEYLVTVADERILTMLRADLHQAA